MGQISTVVTCGECKKPFIVYKIPAANFPRYQPCPYCKTEYDTEGSAKVAN